MTQHLLHWYNEGMHKRKSNWIKDKWDIIREQPLTSEDKEFWKSFKRPPCSRLSKYTVEEKRELRKAQAKKRSLELKRKVLTHYGNGKCTCVRCGYSDLRALSLDHISGGGSRRIQGRTANALRHKLIAAGFPSGYQTLCMNCQFLKREENNEVPGAPRT